MLMILSGFAHLGAMSEVQDRAVSNFGDAHGAVFVKFSESCSEDAVRAPSVPTKNKNKYRFIVWPESRRRSLHGEKMCQEARGGLLVVGIPILPSLQPSTQVSS